MDNAETKARYQEAWRLYQGKRYDQALAILDKLSQAAPQDRDVTYARALTLAALGQANAARDVCDYLSNVLGDPRGEQLKAKTPAQAPPVPLSAAKPGLSARQTAAVLGVLAVCGLVVWGLVYLINHHELHGSWHGFDGEYDTNITCTFAKDKVAVVGENGKEYLKGTFQTDLKADPKQIDIYIEECADKQVKGKTLLGIYRLEGGALTVITRDPRSTLRPTSFRPNLGVKVWTLTK